MNYWLIILAMGVVTFGIRLLPIVLLGRIEIPLVVQRALRFVPPAVLSAIIAPELLMPGGEFSLSLDNARLIAGVIATVVAWRTKNVLATIAVGMITFWMLSAIVR
jgi:branched-subunit amino acid transport protein